MATSLLLLQEASGTTALNPSSHTGTAWTGEPSQLLLNAEHLGALPLMRDAVTSQLSQTGMLKACLIHLFLFTDIGNSSQGQRTLINVCFIWLSIIQPWYETWLSEMKIGCFGQPEITNVNPCFYFWDLCHCVNIWVTATLDCIF